MQVATYVAPPDPVYAEADATFAQTKAYLSSREAQQMRESDLERELHRRGQELIRQLLQGHLDQRGPGEAAGPVAGADGVERPERRVHDRRLETTFGTVDVERVGYGRAGHESLHPLDASLNLPEYVWKAAHVFHREGSPELACWAWTRVRDILEGKARRVAASMRRAATVAGLARDARKPVDTCADYLLKYAPYLHYDRYLAAGYPIATGVIEGACRHLVRDRMDLTGARWRLVDAEAVLKLRALRASGDFDADWDFHEAREYERNHAQHCADRTPPHVTEPSEPPSPPRLRRVK